MINLNSAQESVIKSVFAAIPFAGQPLNEIFYDYRSRIKQDRLNEFSALLAEYFSEHRNVDFSGLNRVEFSDLFESIILRVAHTGSKEKHKRFRDILVGYLQEPQRQLDHTDTFLELVSVLTESSITVLKYHYLCDQEFNRLDQLEKTQEGLVRKAENLLKKELELKDLGVANDSAKYEAELEMYRPELQRIQEVQKTLGKYRRADFYGLAEDDFLYLKQILASRALMIDGGIGAIGHVQYLHMKITTFGKHFIDYIRES
ncbi:MAG: hypothetical protein WC623_15400 [Pedobacter sp.]|uniref:hypothetical protein n=1 Tax=Pedobacter sp. TaxID=1411316 RepID=UPI00356B16E3